MLSAAVKAIAQLADARLRAVFWRGVAVATAVFVMLNVGVWWLLARYDALQPGWINTLVEWLGWLAALLLSVVLFPSLAILVSGLFLDEVADAVEARHYPGLPPARRQGWWETSRGALRLAAMAALLNLLLLPVYLSLLIVGLSFPLFWAVNGYLLGREYFELVALRRLPPAEAAVLRRRHAGQLWLSGAMLAVPFSVPVVNVAAPILATAFMAHMFQTLRRRSGPL